MHEMVRIGKVLKPHGIKGELKVQIDTIYMNAFRKLEAFFIDTLPYFTENISIKKNGRQIFVKLEGVNLIEEAQKLAGKNILIHEKELPVSVSENIYNQLIGYTISDEKTGKQIGVVKDIMEMPMQNLALADYQGKEILLPLNKQTIMKTDKKSKKLLMKIADGLLDI